MDASKLSVLLSLYTEIAVGGLFRLLQRNLGMRVRDGIYTPRLLLWMMIQQRLDGRGTLASSVEQLVQGKFDGLLSRCKRVREKKISLATGGYCQARQNLPKLLVERSVEEILQRLRNHLGERLAGLQGPGYVVDGSTVQLENQAELEAAYPATKNQHGKSHWPVVRIVVLHDVETGLAQPIRWGPVFGPGAVSEQALADQAMEALPPKSVIIGDRNFGIFSTAYRAQLRGHDVVIRLTAARAQRLLGAEISAPREYAVRWSASRWDGRGKPEAPPADAVVRGRLIARRVGRGKKKQWLYLFTTLPQPAQQVVDLYGKRGNVETDLRNLKQTVRLRRLAVQSLDMMEKELMVAVVAYNLVRAIMCLAARQSGIHPRQLSFTWAHNIIQDGIATVLAAPSEVEQVEQLQRIADLVARCRLPRRRKHRSYPREIWRPGFKYPVRREKKTK